MIDLLKGEHMRDIERINRILELIKEIWLYDPDLRFLQMIGNIESRYSKDNSNIGLIEYEIEEKGAPFKYSYTDLFYLEDDKLEIYLIELLNEKKQTKS